MTETDPSAPEGALAAAAPATAEPPPPTPEDAKPKRATPRWVRAMTVFGALLGVVVALIGAAISYFTLQQQAAAYFHHTVFGVDVSYTYPALVDTLILCCTLLYIGGVRRGNPNPWHRTMAWAGIASTVYLNAAAAGGQGVVWHIVPPAVWGFLIEAAAWDARGQRRREQVEEPLDVIPKRLWMADPLGTARLWVYMAMTHTTDYVVARRSVSLVEDAMDAIRCEIPGWSFKPRRARRRIRAKLRRGTLTPDEVLDALGVTDPRFDAEGQLVPRSIDEILQRVHRYVLGERPEPTRAPRPRAPRQPARAPSDSTARHPEPAPRVDETTDRALDETTEPTTSRERAEEARQGIHEPHAIPARSGGREFPHDAARQGVYDEYVRRAEVGAKQLTGKDLAVALGMSEGNGRKVIQQFERIRADHLSAAAAAELPAAVPAPGLARDEERAWDELAGDLEPQEAAPVG